MVQGADAKEEGNEGEDEDPGALPTIRQLGEAGGEKGSLINSIETHIGVLID